MTGTLRWSLHEPPALDRLQLGEMDFERRYLQPEIPVVLEGAMDDSPLLSRWSLSYLRQRYGDVVVTVSSDKARFADQRKRDLPLSRYIDGIDSGEWEKEVPFGYAPFYLKLWAHFDPLWGEHYGDISGDLRVPACFNNHCDRLPSVLKRAITLHIFIGPRGATAWLHQDALATHFWHLCVIGEKYWVFYAPDMIKGTPDKRPVVPDTPPQYVTVQRPGDVIFGPRLWWHEVTTLSPSISISGNFTSRATTSRYLVENVRSAVGRLKRRWMRASGVSYG